jgi:predicted peptidase
MKTTGFRLGIVTAAMLALLAGCSSAGKISPPLPGGTAKMETTVKREVRLRYLLSLPDTYSERGASSPMLLFLHGAGERGDDLELLKKHGPPKLIEAGRKMPFVVVSPQCPSDSWWPDMTGELNALVEEVAGALNVDRSRIYCTGLSMGGFGTWSLLGRYPGLFAAAAPICGGGTQYLARRFKDVPIWVFHGAKDPVVPIRYSEDMVAALKEQNADVRFTVYPEAGHDSWTAAYDDTGLYDWMLSHRKP